MSGFRQLLTTFSPRLLVEIAGLALALYLIADARCSGKRDGTLDAKLAESAEVAAQHKRAADLYRIAADEKAREADSIRKHLTQADALVQKTTKSLHVATDMYRKLRAEYDAIEWEEPDPIQDALNKAADFALEHAEEAIAARDTKIGILEKAALADGERIKLLVTALDRKESQIKAMNDQVKLLTEYRRPGLVHRIAAAAPGLMAAAVVGGFAWEVVRE